MQRGLETNGKSCAAYEENVEEEGPGSSCALQAHEDLVVIECWSREGGLSTPFSLCISRMCQIVQLFSVFVCQNWQANRKEVSLDWFDMATMTGLDN